MPLLNPTTCKSHTVTKTNLAVAFCSGRCRLRLAFESEALQTSRLLHHLALALPESLSLQSLDLDFGVAA